MRGLGREDDGTQSGSVTWAAGLFYGQLRRTPHVENIFNILSLRARRC